MRTFVRLLLVFSLTFSSGIVFTGCGGSDSQSSSSAEKDLPPGGDPAAGDPTDAESDSDRPPGAE